MTDRIIYVALVISVLGLVLLTYVSMVYDPPVSRIGSIDTGSVGKSLHVRGKVSGVHEFKGGSMVLTLDDGSGKLQVYASYSVAKALPGLLKAKELDVVGVVDEYDGILEIKPEGPEQLNVLS